MKNIKLYLEDGNELELETCFLTEKFGFFYSFLFPGILSASPKTLKTLDLMGRLHRCVVFFLNIKLQ